jgi:lipopolysaccharide/colanic/teichoic acid biosynthesis glycosyltransferase
MLRKACSEPSIGFANKQMSGNGVASRFRQPERRPPLSSRSAVLRTATARRHQTASATWWWRWQTLLITCRLWPIVALAVHRKSHGPAAFHQEQVTSDIRVFRRHKFGTASAQMQWPCDRVPG